MLIDTQTYTQTYEHKHIHNKQINSILKFTTILDFNILYMAEKQSNIFLYAIFIMNVNLLTYSCMSIQSHREAHHDKMQFPHRRHEYGRHGD